MRGHRCSAPSPAGDVDLVWDPNEPLPQPVHVTVDDGTSTVEQAFAWGPAGAPAWATADTGAGVVLQVTHTDQVWNPTVHTDDTGAVTHTVMGDAWGANSTVTTVNAAAPAPAIGHSSSIDAARAAGLVHMRARDYDPVTGQFLSPDPWVRPDGQPWIGVHAYTDGDPVSFWDPSGLRGRAGRRLATADDICAPKRDGRGGPTGCHVEVGVYRGVCETWVKDVGGLFSWGDFGRAGHYAIQGDSSKAIRSGVSAGRGWAVTKVAEIAARTSLWPASAAATFVDGTCQAPSIAGKYGTELP